MNRTSHDTETDAMFLFFGPEGSVSARSEQVALGVLLDFDKAAI